MSSKMSHRPLRLDAISIGSTAASRSLDKGRIGQVHSVFGRALNVLTSDNHLISIVRRDVGRGPFNIVTNLPQSRSMDSIGIKRDYEVSKVDELIILGKNVVVISTRNVKRWGPRKNFRHKLLTTEKMKGNLIVVKQVASFYGSFDGLGQLIEQVEDRYPENFVVRKLNLFAGTAKPHISKLLEAIRSGRSQDVKRSAKKLIGFGPGLTPSADDMLSGLMTSLVFMAENLGVGKNLVSEVNESIASCVPGRTSLLSQEFLMHAASGEANEQIATLIEKIMTADAGEVEDATKRVLAIGESSGTDIVLGILLGSQTLLDEARYRYKNV